MKKPVLAVILLLVLPLAVAHAGHGEVDTNASQDAHTEKDVSDSSGASGFEELAKGYSGVGWVIAEVVIVLGLTALAVRHYLNSSEGDEGFLQRLGVGGSGK